MVFICRVPPTICQAHSPGSGLSSAISSIWFCEYRPNMTRGNAIAWSQAEEDNLDQWLMKYPKLSWRKRAAAYFRDFHLRRIGESLRGKRNLLRRRRILLKTASASPSTMNRTAAYQTIDIRDSMSGLSVSRLFTSLSVSLANASNRDISQLLDSLRRLRAGKSHSIANDHQSRTPRGTCKSTRNQLNSTQITQTRSIPIPFITSIVTCLEACASQGY